MRKDWILCGLLSASALGCTSTSMVGAGGQLAGQPSQAEQLAAMQHNTMAGQQQASWTQKLTSTFTGKPVNQPTGPSVPKSHPDLDPITLGYASAPPNAELYLAMAKMSDHGGNAEHARSMYQRALTMQPNHLEGMLALARLEDREGKLDAALHYYKQAVQFHPQSPKALNDLALCYARRNQLNDALPPLERAIALQPGKQLYRNNIAKVLAELNQLDRATQHLSAVHPPSIANYNMGVLLHQRGRDQEAVRYLTAATQSDPSLNEAQSLLAQLSGSGSQLAQATQQPAGNSVLPTQQLTASQPYPTTGPAMATPQVQTFPPATAQMPVNRTPVLLPPVR